MAVKALREHEELQRQERLNAGPLWEEHGLVFASTLGTPLDRSHVRRSLRLMCRNAGIGEDWAPRDLRHTFVSIMSAHGDVPVEEIARLAVGGDPLLDSHDSSLAVPRPPTVDWPVGAPTTAPLRCSLEDRLVEPRRPMFPASAVSTERPPRTFP